MLTEKETGIRFRIEKGRGCGEFKVLRGFAYQENHYPPAQLFLGNKTLVTKWKISIKHISPNNMKIGFPAIWINPRLVQF